MGVYSSKRYREDLEEAVAASVGIERLFHSAILITGASGLIGSYIADMLSCANETLGAGIRVYAMARNPRSLRERFLGRGEGVPCCISHDVCEELRLGFQADYIIHAASNAYPASFREDPVGTIMCNVLGTKNILDYGVGHGCARMLFVSSGEVYGQGDIGMESYEESYSGYVDPTRPRSCYPSGKRAAETLCASYSAQYGLDVVIARPSHTYGPCATREDDRANAQFAGMAIAGRDIVLKSPGGQLRSYTYVADAASGILSALCAGESGAAYNVAVPGAEATIAGFAEEVASAAGVEVRREAAGEDYGAGQTPIEKQVLDSGRLRALGWNGRFSVHDGVRRMLGIMEEAR